MQVLFLFTAVGVYYNHIDDRAASIGLFVFIAVGVCWMASVANGIVTFSVSGLYSTYYFLYATDSFPRDPSIKYLKRALTKSFGSICAAGLFSFSRNDLFFIYPVPEMFARFCNDFTFTHMAIFGKGYFASAKNGLRLAKECGMHTVVDKGAIDAVHTYFCISSAVMAGAIASYLTPVGFYIAVFTVSAFLMASSTSALFAGISTMFTSISMDPESVHRTAPELYYEFDVVHPKIIESVPR